MKEQKAASKKGRSQFSKLSLYIMLSGWVGFAVYVFLFFFVLDIHDGETFLEHFLSTDNEGMRFRALIFFSPFISTVIGFLVNEREKFFCNSMTSKARYHDLFEHANDVIFVIGQDTAILEANCKAAASLGYDREVLKTKRLRDLMRPEDVEMLNHRAPEERFVCKLQTRSGDWLDMELTSSAIIEDGQAAGSRIVARDITDFKNMQEELSRAYEELQMSFTDKSGQLTDAKKLLLFESYERHKAEETINELLMRKKFGEQTLPELPEIIDEDPR